MVNLKRKTESFMWLERKRMGGTFQFIEIPEGAVVVVCVTDVARIWPLLVFPE